MSAPRFVVAVRDKEGVAKLFDICHSEIQDYEVAMALVRAEIPDARVILASVN